MYGSLRGVWALIKAETLKNWLKLVNTMTSRGDKDKPVLKKTK